MDTQIEAVDKYKIFTRHEYNSAVAVYESDFRSLFYCITELKAEEKLQALLMHKYEYEIRFLEKGEVGKHSHVHKKLMCFIDSNIFNLVIQSKKINNSGNLILTFQDLFKDRRQAYRILEGLLDGGYIFRSNHTEFEWRKTERNAVGKELEALFKILKSQNLIKDEYEKDYSQISIAVGNTFNVKRSAKTFNRSHEYSLRDSISKIRKAIR
ncbi:MAG: hypothetical protein ACK5CT_10445 [Bacteroidota bacterium]